MTRSVWKAWERFWALQLGGTRVPVTGRGRGDVPDVEHPLFAIEVKVGKRLLSERMREGIDQAVASVKASKTPLLCLTERRPGRRDCDHYVLMRLADFQALHGGPTVE